MAIYKVFLIRFGFLQLNGTIKPMPPPRDTPLTRVDGKDSRHPMNRTPLATPPQLPERKISTTTLGNNTTNNTNNNNVINNNNNNNNSNSTSANNNISNNIAQIVEPTLEQLDSIKKYQVNKMKRTSISSCN